MGVFLGIAVTAGHDLLSSTHFATINPGTPSAAHSACRARSIRFGNSTCRTSRNIGAVTRLWPVGGGRGGERLRGDGGKEKTMHR